MSSIDGGPEAQSSTIWVFHPEALVLCVALPNRMPAILRPSSLRPSSDSQTSLVITRHQELKTSVETSPHWESRRKGRAPSAFSHPNPAGECPSRRSFEVVLL